MWTKHHKTPSWFKKRPRGEQIFLLAADLWALEDEAKPRSSSGVAAADKATKVNTMTLQQFAKLK